MKNKQTSQNKFQKGFTLVEMLLYMGIASILLFVLFDLFTAILATHAESQSTSTIDQDAAFILNRLSFDIHQASISNPTLGTPACTATPLSTACHLTLSNGTMYQLDSNGNLLITVGGVSNQLNSNTTKINSITFETRGNSAAGSKLSEQIQFTVQSLVKTNTTKTYQTTITTR